VLPMDAEGLEIQAMPTMGDELTNQVFFTDVFVGDEYLVGELGMGFRYISEALDLERFTMYQTSPLEQRVEELVEYVKTAARDDQPLRDDPVIRDRIAELATDLRAAQALGKRFVDRAKSGGKPPTVEASQYKLFATHLNQRIANSMMDIASPQSQLRVHQQIAPMRGRAEMVYRYSVLDTIGAGSSEIQKNIIARRGLGLPKNTSLLLPDVPPGNQGQVRVRANPRCRVAHGRNRVDDRHRRERIREVPGPPRLHLLPRRPDPDERVEVRVAPPLHGIATQDRPIRLEALARPPDRLELDHALIAHQALPRAPLARE